MAITYEPIATTTLGSAQTSTTFSSISGSYTDIVIVANVNGSSTNADFGLRFNSDTGSNYSATAVDGTGSAASSWRRSNQTEMLFNNNAYITANSFTTAVIISVQDYSNTTTNKTVLTRFNNAGNGVTATVGLWRNTAAINSITLLATNSGFGSGSTFTLYGIKEA